MDELYIVEKFSIVEALIRSFSRIGEKIKKLQFFKIFG